MLDKPTDATLDLFLDRAQKKCCGKCAFRFGSPERSDGYGWVNMMELHVEHNLAFFCHETIPGHPQEVKDGTERFRLCAGRLATRHLSLDKLCALTIIDLKAQATS